MLFQFLRRLLFPQSFLCFHLKLQIFLPKYFRDFKLYILLIMLNCFFLLKTSQNLRTKSKNMIARRLLFNKTMKTCKQITGSIEITKPSFNWFPPSAHAQESSAPCRGGKLRELEVFAVLNCLYKLFSRCCFGV